MLFMANITVNLPGELPAEEKERLTHAEHARAMELVRAGHLRRIWRVVGERSNFSVWEADTLEELHAAIGSLPFHPWMQLKVTPLIEHPATQKWEAEEGPWPTL